ncbi:hypothetical protein KC19_3G019400 [Ceratodon purpureus]|uniref:Secreted protein n=1 Tax=Ceratodon purpureus TaxID=3225 RepID=A0A8T0IG81_CERPU|nr:hypothetical protein KC19_3G019400 [Ceratodon purpureus]
MHRCRIDMGYLCCTLLLVRCCGSAKYSMLFEVDGVFRRESHILLGYYTFFSVDTRTDPYNTTQVAHVYPTPCIFLHRQI